MNYSDVFVDVTKHARKIPTSEYQKSGKYPIIDQGQKQIAGYTDIEEGLFTDVPAIIFGDHTRIIKYIDTPFFIGADGVKVIKCLNKGADYKYFYYLLKSAKIPDTGYNRHYKWLKESVFPEHNKQQQKLIVDTLTAIDKLMCKYNAEKNKLDELIKSRFVEMFGDPVSNSKQLAHITLREISELITKGSSPSWQGFNYIDDETQTLFITSENVREGYLDIKSPKYLEDSFNEKQKKSILKTGDFLINIVGASIGRAAEYSLNRKANINQAVALVRLKKGIIHNSYLSSYLNSERAFQMYDSMKSDTGRANLSLQDIGNLIILTPSIHLQKQYADFVKQVKKQKATVQKSIEKLETLKKSLMQEYFG